MPRKVEVSEETWDKLRAEYISSPDVSMRGLQKKYGIPFNAIKNRVDGEEWNQKRIEFSTRSMQKSIDLLVDHRAKECTKAFRVASAILDKIEAIVSKIDDESPDALRDIKSATSAIKDLKEIGLFRAELDRQEQEARINKLRKDAEEEQVDTTITVVFEEDGYAN